MSVKKKSLKQASPRAGWVKFFVGLAIVLIVVGVYWYQYQGSHRSGKFVWRVVFSPPKLAHLSRQQLTAALAPVMHSDFFTVDINQLKQRLSKLQWLDHVSIRRVWPNELLIHVAQKLPVARFNTASLFTAKGQLFTPATLDTAMHQLPLLQAPQKESAKVWAYYEKYNQMLKPLGLSVVQLFENSVGCLHLQLNSSVYVYLGCVEPSARLQRFVGLYPKVIGPRASQVASVDLRYAHGLAIKWRGKGVRS